MYLKGVLELVRGGGKQGACVYINSSCSRLAPLIFACRPAVGPPFCDHLLKTQRLYICLPSQCSVLNSNVYKEVSTLTSGPPVGIRFFPITENITDVRVSIEGPEGTPYTGGIFGMQLILGYFLTKIFHPHISSNGGVCAHALKTDLKAGLGVRHILLSIQCLLIHLKPELAQNEDPRLIPVPLSYAHLLRYGTRSASRIPGSIPPREAGFCDTHLPPPPFFFFFLSSSRFRTYFYTRLTYSLQPMMQPDFGFSYIHRCTVRPGSEPVLRKPDIWATPNDAIGLWFLIFSLMYGSPRF
uniref:UBC core domain-containing protein n=1 Tax=Leptobrachium leishanense TaxID=445787 RepID=A0A8C5QLL2_9ANUR